MNQIYKCSCCGVEVEIEQECYDMYDFDGKCMKCYYKVEAEKRPATN